MGGAGLSKKSTRRCEERTMTPFEKLVLRALAAILYCVMFTPQKEDRPPGHESRLSLLEELRNKASY